MSMDIRSRLFFVIAIPMILGVILTYARGWHNDYRLRQEITKLEQNVRELEHRKLESLALFEYVKSTAYAEEKARTELNLQKPNERVIVIEKNRTAIAEESENKSDETRLTLLSNPKKWWYYILHRSSQ